MSQFSNKVPRYFYSIYNYLFFNYLYCYYSKNGLPIVDKENDRKSKLELEVIKEGYKIVESSSKDSTKVVCDANESSTKSIKVVTDYVENNYH